MKSIKLMFLMFVIGMITFTSCTSETEQTAEVKTEKSTTNQAKEFTDEELATLAVECNVNGTFDPNMERATIVCIKIKRALASNEPTTATACVSVNGVMFWVSYQSEYYQGGYWMSGYNFAIKEPNCRCQ